MPVDASFKHIAVVTTERANALLLIPCKKHIPLAGVGGEQTGRVLLEPQSVLGPEAS